MIRTKALRNQIVSNVQYNAAESGRHSSRCEPTCNRSTRSAFVSETRSRHRSGSVASAGYVSLLDTRTKAWVVILNKKGQGQPSSEPTLMLAVRKLSTGVSHYRPNTPGKKHLQRLQVTGLGKDHVSQSKADYAVALLLLGFVVSLAGQGSTYWLMSRLQRRSIVIIAMASLMLLATAVMYYESIVTFLYALHHHTLTERGHICTQRS
ncbi:hypothetical protein WJX82_007509 [Trebouxia sp. C0006]